METEMTKYVREETNPTSLKELARECLSADCSQCELAEKNFRKCIIEIAARHMELTGEDLNPNF